MGWRDWQISDDWTHKPVWLPPYPINFGFWGNLTPFYTKKEAMGEQPFMLKKRYYFFDTLDYEDCHKKMFNYGIIGAKVASFVAVMQVFGDKQLSYTKALGRAGGHFGRIGGTFLMYAAVTCSIANLRGQKHDTYEYPWNHMIGGASVGLIWGYKYHSTGIGFGVAVLGALFGALNLRANTPTETHPKGWLINFPENIDDIRVENGALGGRNYRDMRFNWRLNDPGRKGLE